MRSRLRSLFDAMPALFVGGSQVVGSVSLGKESTPAAQFQRTLGWRVGMLETRADKLTKFLFALESTLGDRALPKLLKERVKLEASLLPKLKHRAVAVRGFQPRGTAFAFELPAALLAKIGKEAGATAPSAAGQKPAQLTLVVVPDAERSFIALAPDEKTALRLLEETRAGGLGKLGDVAELQPLKSQPSVGGGFFTLQALWAALASVARARGQDVEGQLALAPNHGQTPWLTRADEAPAREGVRLTASIRLPQKAFEDVAAILPSLANLLR